MSQPAIEAPIVSTFDPKGVQQATKGFGNLEKSFKKFGLAQKLSFAALTTLAVKYGREAVKAAAADEAAQRKLIGTLRNLGKEYAATGVNQFIKQQEIASGVSKDILRPELEKLMLVTDTVGQAQDLLSTALDVSAGSSYSLTQVTSALAKAQTGNLSALKKMTLGIDSATLESGNLYLIQRDLNRLFAGQASKANQGLAADMNRIRISAANAKEEIGKGLTKSIEAFIEGAGGVDTVNRSMENYSKLVSQALASTEGLSRSLGKIVNAPFILADLSVDISEGLSKALGGMKAPKGFGAETFSEDKRMFNRVQNLKYQLDLTKKTATEEKKLSDLRKKSAATTKLEQMFNNDLVSINAALQNKVTDEIRGRLIALRATKTEDQNDDQKAILELIALQKKRADDAVTNWETESAAAKKSYADQYAAYLELLNKIKNNPLKTYVEFVSQSGQKITVPESFGIPGKPILETPMPPLAPAPKSPVSSAPPTYPEFAPALSDTTGFAGGGTVAGIPVAGVAQSVNIDVAVNGFVGNEQQLAEEIARKLQLAQKLGYSTSIVGVS